MSIDINQHCILMCKWVNERLCTMKVLGSALYSKCSAMMILKGCVLFLL